jgi:isocitrate dehydrogenase
LVTTWEKPIVVGRHAHADQYKATDIKIETPGKLELVFQPENGGPEQRFTVNNYEGPGVAMGMYNTEASIIDFAHCCFKFSLDRGFPLYLSTKNTILKVYDGMFKDVFQVGNDTECFTDLGKLNLTMVDQF